MIVQITFLLAVIIVVTATAVDGVASFARSSLERKIAGYTAIGSRAELQIVQTTIGNDIIKDDNYVKAFASGTPIIAPSPIAVLENPSVVLATESESGGEPFETAVTTADAYTIQTSATIESSTSCSSTPAACPNEASAAQFSGWVQEARISLALTSSVYLTATYVAGSGKQTVPSVATRTQYATLRLYAQPPFSTVVGIKDAASSDPGGFTGATAVEGDSGGLNVQTPTAATPPPDPSANGSGNGDTSIHVVYTCSPSPDGNACPTVTPAPDSDSGLPDTQQPYSWANENATASWSR